MLLILEHMENLYMPDLRKLLNTLIRDRTIGQESGVDRAATKNEFELHGDHVKL